MFKAINVKSLRHQYTWRQQPTINQSSTKRKLYHGDGLGVANKMHAQILHNKATLLPVMQRLNHTTKTGTYKKVQYSLHKTQKETRRDTKRQKET